jgi:diguanylate cyclase
VGIVVEKSNGKLLHMGTRGHGSVIGEMAIVDNQPRSANIKSLENCTLLEITKDDFARSVRGADPIVRLIAQVILMRYWDILRRYQALFADSADSPSPEELEREYAEQINVVEAIKMANEFKVAIATQQLILNYQPILSIATGRILGFEALMRWQHTERGLIPPDMFIPMAEDSGLILGASRWAIREVCQMINRLDQARPDMQDLYVSVNLSAADSDDENFLDNL